MLKEKIITVDFDGTLCKEVAWDVEAAQTATPIWTTINKVNELFPGNFIVIYTARIDELIPASLAWLRRHGVRFHAISNNKIPADLYIDDKAVLVDTIVDTI